MAAAILDFLGVSESEGRVPKRRVSGSKRADASREGGYAEDAAPVEMFHLGQEIVAEIGLLREALAVADFPVEAELLTGRGAPHLYAKSLEVMAKIRRVRQQFGYDELPSQPLLGGEFTDASLLLVMGGLVRELRELKSLMEVDRRIDPISNVGVGSASYSVLYKLLGDASFLLDGLIGQSLTSREVFRNLVKAADLMSVIAARVGSDLTPNLPAVPEAKSVTDVEQQLGLAIEKAVALQSSVGLAPSAVPSLSLVRVSPSENYDAANILYAELLRIAAHLNVEGMSDERPVPPNVSSTEVYALALLLNTNLAALGETLR